MVSGVVVAELRRQTCNVTVGCFLRVTWVVVTFAGEDRASSPGDFGGILIVMKGLCTRSINTSEQ